MISILRALANLVTPRPPWSTHDELEHRHWDRETRTWRPHEQQEEEDEPAA